MNKAILAIATAAALAVGTLAVPRPAEAYCHHCGPGWGWGGVLGGLGAGIIIGSAIAGRPGYVYYDGCYGGPPDCDAYCARRRLYNRRGEFVGWSRPHWYCR